MYEFSGSGQTAQFILLFNDIFDVFNSRNYYAKYNFKRPVTENN